MLNHGLNACACFKIGCVQSQIDLVINYIKVKKDDVYIWIDFYDFISCSCPFFDTSHLETQTCHRFGP